MSFVSIWTKYIIYRKGTRSAKRILKSHKHSYIRTTKTRLRNEDEFPRSFAVYKSVYRTSADDWTTSKQWQWILPVRQFERRWCARRLTWSTWSRHTLSQHGDESGRWTFHRLCNMVETICRSRLVIPVCRRETDYVNSRLTSANARKKKKKKKQRLTVHLGELSYSPCYAIGQILWPFKL